MINIKAIWHRLNQDTRQWLMDNSECAVLPRNVVAAIARCASAHGAADGDAALAEMGNNDLGQQPQLSSDDRMFIRTRTHSVDTVRDGVRFFDAVQPVCERQHSEVN